MSLQVHAREALAAYIAMEAKMHGGRGNLCLAVPAMLERVSGKQPECGA